MGRTFDAARDQAPGGEPVVVLSYDTWQQQFNSDRQIIGGVHGLTAHPS